MTDVHPNVIRGPIESEYNELRDDIEATYISDKVALEKEYHEDLEENRQARAAALVADGLNPDGSTPTTYPGTADPANAVLPSVSGTTTVGQTLTGTNGTWQPDGTFTYQWERADPDGSNNEDISGATAITRVLAGGDSGKKLRIRVTATNPIGSTVARSAYTATIAAS